MKKRPTSNDSKGHVVNNADKMPIAAKESQRQVDPTPGFERIYRARRYARIGLKPHAGPVVMPSPGELAMLAATIRKNDGGEHAAICATALDLWFAAQEVITLQRQCEVDFQEERQRANAEKITVPEPKKYPVSRDEFTDLMLPDKKGRTADRADILKEWLRHELGHKQWMAGDQLTPWNGVPLSRAEAVEAFRNMVPMAISDYQHNARRFLAWHRDWKSAAKSATRSASAERKHFKSFVMKDLKEKLRRKPTVAEVSKVFNSESEYAAWKEEKKKLGVG